jgi:hypothetical protein
MFGRTETNTRVNGNHVSGMGTVLTFLLTGMNTLDNISMGNLMAMDNISGLMEILILECFLMALNMAKVNGRNAQGRMANQTPMKETMPLTERMAGELSNGRVVISIKVNMLMTREMALEKCNGLTGVSIKEFGSKEFSMVLA